MSTYDIQGRVTLIPYEAPPEPEPPAPLPDPITGLVARSADKNNCPMDRVADLGGTCAEIKWGESQPVMGAELRDPGDPANTEWAQMQYARQTELPIRLRAYTGRWAPDWAKWLVGPHPAGDQRNEIPQESPTSGDISTCAHYWLAPYLEAASDWLQQLIELFEDDDQIVSIAWHPATTTYAEPFQRGTGSKTDPASIANRQGLVDAGLPGAYAVDGGGYAPDPQDAFAIRWPINNWLGFSERKRLYLPFNPLQAWLSVDGTEAGPITNPGNFTEEMIALLYAMLEEQAEGANNSLRAPISGSDYLTAVYGPLSDHGRQGGLSATQTATMSTLGDTWRRATDANGKPPSDQTDAAGMIATLDLAFGITTPGNDPYGCLRGLDNPLTFRSVELPSGWPRANLSNGSSALSAAKCKQYNDQAANQPNGTAVVFPL